MLENRLYARIAKNILKGSFSVGNSVCLILWEIGEITIESFFTPNYSFTKPTRELFNLSSGVAIKDDTKKDTIQVSIRRLIKQGIVKKNKNYLRLTSKGRRLLELIIKRKQVLKYKWDKKYRVVIFDIPEKKKHLRKWLREELYLLDYVPLQKSVFISKYPLTSDIIKNINKFKISKHVNYLLVEKLYDAEKIKNQNNYSRH